MLLAIGLSLIFGLMTVVNFSHGALYMLGAYFGFLLITYTGSFSVALIVAPTHGRRARAPHRALPHPPAVRAQP